MQNRIFPKFRGGTFPENMFERTWVHPTTQDASLHQDGLSQFL